MSTPVPTEIDEAMVSTGYDYLQGLAPIDRTIVALAAHDHLDFPGQECWENKQSIIQAMTAGLVGSFRRQEDILSYIGAQVTKYRGMKPKDLYINLSHDG